MRVCWDAEVGVRAPCGALSTQDSQFLPIFRMIARAADAAAGLALRLGRGELELDVVGERDAGRVREARVAGRRAEVRDVERPLGLLAGEGARGDRPAVADDLHPGPDALPLRPRDGGDEGDPASRSQQAEGNAFG